jgi:hypothetical protein
MLEPVSVALLEVMAARVHFAATAPATATTGA